MSRHIQTLLKSAGSTAHAHNELRWIQEAMVNGLIGPCKLSLEQAVQRRGEGFPLQYILGTQPFNGLDIQCRPGALIPRWETEEWTHKLAKLTKNEVVLDLCTGTGCVLFSLLQNSNVSGTGVDISEQALDVFKLNLTKLGLQRKCRYRLHDVFKPLPTELRECTLITANPPYIKSISDADTQVSLYEPGVALLEPKSMYEQLVLRVMETSASRAVFEVGCKDQINLCISLFAKNGWKAHGEKDGAGLWRTVWASKASK